MRAKLQPTRGVTVEIRDDETRQTWRIGLATTAGEGGRELVAHGMQVWRWGRCVARFVQGQDVTDLAVG